MKPKTIGIWWMRSSETDGDWGVVEIFFKNGILMVDDAYLGIVALDDYHENLIDIEWKPDNEADDPVSELSDLLDGLIPAKELIKIAFPECSKQCAAVDYFGVCECESVCPQKFDEAGRAINI